MKLYASKLTSGTWKYAKYNPWAGTWKSNQDAKMKGFWFNYYLGPVKVYLDSNANNKYDSSDKLIGIAEGEGGSGYSGGTWNRYKLEKGGSFSGSAWGSFQITAPLIMDTSEGIDKIVGSKKTDKIYGKGGNDFLYGSGGNDIVNGGSGEDKLYGGSGKDKLYGGSGKDKLYGGSGKDKLYGGSSKDKLIGGAGKDKLIGGAGEDILKGGWGNDVLKGGLGNDVLRGGSGADTYVASEGTDTIYGFNIQAGDLLSGFGDTSGLDISDSGTFCIVSGNGYTAKLKGVDAVDLIAAMESVFA